ncbi:2Fe-2S iron-sulfur cluster-binding protein [Chryseobacterium sp.]|uniref:2Fe-2S iron-sulfur cluster-binding protein n=1 Tax=Chryseobacterium sp. TaxID=1871047 RepID=UPI00388ED3F3
MEQLMYKGKLTPFHPLKIKKKEDLTKNTISLELDIPEDLVGNFVFQSGQYVSLQFKLKDGMVIYDYSITSAPHENKITLGIKISSTESSAFQLYKNYRVGDVILVSEPSGRFTIDSKPHEFRTIVAFAGGIGITPLLSHFKNILHTEPRTRLFLFYGNKSKDEVVYRDLLDNMAKLYQNRLQIYYFYSQEKTDDLLFYGRLDEKKLNLIINQILHLDDTDEESTIWDAVDEVLICGKESMVKSLANACYHHGIRKKNIHYELFDELIDEIYPSEKQFPLIENIKVEFTILGKNYSTLFKNNKEKILQQLLEQNYPVPYSCKAGICGSCECKVEEGEVELLENEYLTEKEEEQGRILACMSIARTNKIKLNFDLS